MRRSTSSKHAQHAKEPWSAPQLTVYGSLTKLTAKVGNTPEPDGSFPGFAPGPPR